MFLVFQSFYAVYIWDGAELFHWSFANYCAQNDEHLQWRFHIFKILDPHWCILYLHFSFLEESSRHNFFRSDTLSCPNTHTIYVVNDITRHNERWSFPVFLLNNGKWILVSHIYKLKFSAMYSMENVNKYIWSFKVMWFYK